MARSLLLIGNPDNKRTVRLQEARRKLGLPPAQVLPYIDLLRGDADLSAYAARLGPAPILRLDSPGEEWAVERELIAWGDPEQEGDDALSPSCTGPAASPAAIPADAARRLPEERGRLYAPAQWYRGWCRLLARLQREAAACWPQARWMNDPEEIAVMFDKRRCHELLSAHGIPVPRTPPSPPGGIRDYAMLREMIEATGWHRWFIKLACGSGASGVIAYQLHPRTGAELAQTTLGMERRGGETVYYNAGRLRRYTDRATIAAIVDWLCSQGAQIELWIGKAAFEGRAFDIRQLVVAGKACHRTARLSRTPITNLHLGSMRLPPEQTGLPPDALAAVQQAAEHTLAAFPGSMVAGVDVLVSSGSLQPYIADINPFGDLLYEVTHHGYTTYEWEMKLLQEEDERG